jgi:LacI family transcriptional regulator
MVLNKKSGIGEKTREKVLKIAQENGYDFSKKSKKDRGNLQLTVYKKHAKVVNDTPFFHSLIEGIESEARRNSYKLNITYITNETKISDIADDINKHSIEGMLLIGTEMDEEDFRKFEEIDIPVLLLDSNFLNINANYAVLDNVMGMHKAVKHFVEKGHKKIGYLRSSIEIVNFNERFQGYKKTLEEMGVEYYPELTVSLMPNMDSAYEDMMEVLKSNPELPTAYVADNDLIAMGAVKALKEYNVKIPEQVSIIGFDDMPFCSMSEPTLTTIEVNKKEFGRLGVDKLVDIIEGNHVCNCKTVLGVDMVERDSVYDLT